MKPSENPAWLAVEGWCTPEEGDALYEQASKTEGAIVEVGTAYGRSAIALAMGSDRVTTYDSDPDEARRRGLAANIERCDVQIEAIYRDSRMAARAWKGPVSFLFIDGWHDAENVRADYQAWAPHVIPGGSIWFHDAYGAGWPDVHALIDKLVASGALVLDGYVGTIAKCRKGAA